MVKRTGLSSPRRNGLPRGLLAAWDLRRGAAFPIPNLVAAGSALTAPASPGVPVITGTGLQFDGVNDYASTGEYPLGAAGTLIAVARSARAFPSDTGSSAWRGLIGKCSAGNVAGTAYLLEWNGTNAERYIRLVLSNGTSFNTTAFYSFNFAGAFHCIAGRWGTPDAKTSVWINGVKGNEQAQTVNANAGLSMPLRLGQSFGTIANAWSGEIAFAAIYDRALTDQEMKQAYCAITRYLKVLQWDTWAVQWASITTPWSQQA